MGKEKSCLFLISILICGSGPYLAFAQTDSDLQFTKVGGDIHNNSVAQQILKKIEESKKILADLKAGKPKIPEQQKIVEQQRLLAKAKLQEDLAAMSKEYEPYTSKNAYSSFLAGINSTYRGIFLEQFSYMDSKVQIAKTVKASALAQGANRAEAAKAFAKSISFMKTENIDINSKLNIKHGFSDSQIQSNFDKNGKIPRTDDSKLIPCFSCKKYSPLAQKIILASLEAKNK